MVTKFVVKSYMEKSLKEKTFLNKGELNHLPASQLGPTTVTTTSRPGTYNLLSSSTTPEGLSQNFIDSSTSKPRTPQVPPRPGQSRKGAPRNSRTHSFTPYAAPPPGMSADMSFPMYYILRSATSKTLTEHRTIPLSRALEKALGVEDPPVTLMRNGSILVKAANRNQSSILSSLTSLGDVPIISTPDDIRNTSKGTIYCPIQRDEDTAVILEELQQRRFSVTNIYRFPPRRETPDKPNPRLLLTFNTPYPPTKVKIGFTSYSVRTFIPRPRRCFKCQRFGHPRKYCRGQEDICPICGELFHTPCENTPNCRNCKGPHSASSFKCPSYLFEQEVLELCTIHKLSRRDAIRQLNEKYQTNQINLTPQLQLPPRLHVLIRQHNPLLIELLS